MSESTVTEQRGTVANPPPPPIDPDEDLMADLEGNRSAVAAYKREAVALRKAAASR